MTIEEASERVSGNELMVQYIYDLTETSDEWLQASTICKAAYGAQGIEAKDENFIPMHKTEEEQHEENLRAMEMWELHINGG